MNTKTIEKTKTEDATIGNCKQCGQVLKRKSKNGRFPTFCSTGCRVKHWRGNQ